MWYLLIDDCVLIWVYGIMWICCQVCVIVCIEMCTWIFISVFSENRNLKLGDQLVNKLRVKYNLSAFAMPASFTLLFPFTKLITRLMCKFWSKFTIFLKSVYINYFYTQRNCDQLALYTSKGTFYQWCVLRIHVTVPPLKRWNFGKQRSHLWEAPRG